jgi:hypothetical protein
MQARSVPRDSRQWDPHRGRLFRRNCGRFCLNPAALTSFSGLESEAQPLAKQRRVEKARSGCQPDLLPAGAANDVVAKHETRGAQSLDFPGDVGNDQVDAVPAARLGDAAVGHRPSRGAGGAA